MRKNDYARWLWQFKDVPCKRCGGKFHPVSMDFHHRDPVEKVFSLGNTNEQSYRSECELLAEIAKCDVVCANCHRVITHMEARNKSERTIQWETVHGAT